MDEIEIPIYIYRAFFIENPTFKEGISLFEINSNMFVISIWYDNLSNQEKVFYKLKYA